MRHPYIVVTIAAALLTAGFTAAAAPPDGKGQANKDYKHGWDRSEEVRSDRAKERARNYENRSGYEDIAEDDAEYIDDKRGKQGKNKKDKSDDDEDLVSDDADADAELADDSESDKRKQRHDKKSDDDGIDNEASDDVTADGDEDDDKARKKARKADKDAAEDTEKQERRAARDQRDANDDGDDADTVESFAETNSASDRKEATGAGKGRWWWPFGND